MAKRYNNDDEEFEDYGSGAYSSQDKLLDKLDLEDDNEELDLDDNEELEDIKPKKGISNIKPKLMGKHSLAHDNIFKGKKIEAVDDSEMIEDSIIKQASGSFDISSGEDTIEHEESRNNIEYHRDLKLQQEIYNCLKNNTDLKFIDEDGRAIPRRKAGKYDLNNYFKIIISDLVEYGWSYTEMFIELSQYFSDNTWAVFNILNTDYKELIITELSEKRDLKQIKKINFF
jgi:hypothetical protein